MVQTVSPKTSNQQDDPKLYNNDFHAWTVQQAEYLRQEQWQNLDLPNLAEEIAALGRKERQELRNRLSLILGHLLKWEYQPQLRSRSWLATIRIQRRDTQRLLKENPSLKAYLTEILPEAYANGRDLAMGETNLPAATFPETCPYSLENVLAEDFFSGTASDLLD